MGPIETRNSDANYVVMYAQNGRWGLGPMETSNSGANHAVLHAQSDRWGLRPTETINSGHTVAVVNAKTTDESGDPQRLVILMLKAQFWMHKTTDEGWDQ